MNGHTPAPWKIEKYSDANTRDGERIRSDNGLIVVNEVWGASLSECDANYKLIAAAPELLAACIRAQEMMDRDYSVSPCPEYATTAWQAVRAALLKAGVYV